jgi:hypothetical protein
MLNILYLLVTIRLADVTRLQASGGIGDERKKIFCGSWGAGSGGCRTRRAAGQVGFKDGKCGWLDAEEIA